MADRSKIIGKIRALMNKTVENGCSEAEAMTAAQKVSDMMEEHDIACSDLNFRDETCKEDKFSLSRGTKHAVHYCYQAVAAYTGTKGYYSCTRDFGSHYYFFGLPVDVEIAQYLMKLIHNCMEKSIREFKESGGYEKYRHGKTARDSFLKGMACTISMRLQIMTAERRANMQKSTGRDLVVVKDQLVTEEFNKANIRVRDVKNPGIKVGAMSAFQHGSEAGSKVNLTTGIESVPNGLLK